VDILDADSLRDVIQERRPDVVVNAAAMANHDACAADEALAMQINAEAAQVLAQAARQVDARFVQISTDAVFDGRIGGYQESDQPNPSTAYGRTKYAGEQLVIEANPESLIVRTNFFGWSPSGTRSILEFFVNALSRGERVNGFVNYSVTTAFVDEVSTALVELVDQQVSGIVHVASADSLTKDEFGHLVAVEFGLDAELISPMQAQFESGSDHQDLSLDTEKVSSLLGRQMPTQADGVKQARLLRAKRSFQ
jgi:dTDP-4-dehydrorhamnose reductase